MFSLLEKNLSAGSYQANVPAKRNTERLLDIREEGICDKLSDFNL